MFKEDENMVRKKFVLLLVAACCTAVLSFGCKKSTQGTVGVEAALPAGEWVCYDGDDAYSMKIAPDGSIRLFGQGYFDLAYAFEGKLTPSEKGYAYELKPLSFEGGSSETGVLFLEREEGKLRLRFEKAPAGVVNNMLFFKKGEPVKVKIIKSPTVVDLFKAARPYTFDIKLEKFDEAISSKEATIDIKNGYMSMSLTSGGAESPLIEQTSGSVEARMWSAPDKSLYVLAINILGEAKHIMPTEDLLFFEYKPAAGTLAQKEMLPARFADWRNRKPQTSFKLPMEGTDIILGHVEDFSGDAAEYIKWNGKGFEAK